MAAARPLLWMTTALLILALAPTAGAQDAEEPDITELAFTDWLNAYQKNRVRARLGRRSPSNQTEVSTSATNTTSLLDLTSGTDFISVGLNLAELGGEPEDEADRDSVTATASLHAIQSALRGRNPLGPAYYCDQMDWRRGFLTLGYEGEDDAMGQDDDDAVIFGAKVLLWNRRDPCRSEYQSEFEGLVQTLGQAGTAFGNIAKDVQDQIIEGLLGTSATTVEKIELLNKLSGTDTSFEPWLEGKPEGPALLRDIKRTIDQAFDEEDAFLNLERRGRQIFETINGAPQISLGFQGKVRDEGDDVYNAQFLVDCGAGCGLAERIDFTANGSLDYSNNSGRSDEIGGKVAAQMKIRLNPAQRALEGRRFNLTFGFVAEWLENTKDTYKGQVKFAVPVFAGLEVPISLTFANRTELVEESEVRGQVGFSVDTSQLLEALSIP